MKSERIIKNIYWDHLNTDLIYVEYFKDKGDHLIIKKTCD